MTERLLNAALRNANTDTPPVWLMRQAGRYHSHYQNIRKEHGFVEMCKEPSLAAEVAMGPINDFDFDAAILFSDILYVIEAMGPGLTFDPGPKFEYYLKSAADLEKYTVDTNTIRHMDFQAEAVRQTRQRLPDEKALIGFVGSPLTLYIFAVHGTHKTDLADARNGLRDGRFEGFMERLIPLLVDNMVLQAKAGCDAMAVFESVAGDISEDDFKALYLPHLEKLLTAFHAQCPDVPLIYHLKGGSSALWDMIKHLPIAAMGIDPAHDLAANLPALAKRIGVQGNFDPQHFTLPENEFEQKANAYFSALFALPAEARTGWICGAGDGVTPLAKEANIRRFVQLSRQYHAGAAS